MSSATDDAEPFGTRHQDSIGWEVRVGGGAIATFFFLFLGWAALTPLDAGAYATGQVEVSGNRQAVQHRDGGVVSALYVSEGENVLRGQVLAELLIGELVASERALSGQIIALQAQRARLIAERDELIDVVPPPEFAALTPVESALATEAMRLQQRQFAARRSSRRLEAATLQQRIGQLREQQLGYQRQIDAASEQRRLIEDELTGIRSLAARGFAPQRMVRTLERTAAGLDGELGSLHAEVARAAEQIGEAQVQISSVSSRLQEDVADQLRQVEVQLNELAPRLTNVRDQISRGQLRSPVDGQIMSMTTFTVGGVVQPGQTLMEIVPRNAVHVIVARIDPGSIDSIRTGLLTEVRFPGLRDRNPPILRGRVTRIAADSSEDERTGERYYRTEIVLPAEEMQALGPLAPNVRPGMPVEVVVILRRRSALSSLIEPLSRNLWIAGRT